MCILAVVNKIDIQLRCGAPPPQVFGAICDILNIRMRACAALGRGASRRSGLVSTT